MSRVHGIYLEVTWSNPHGSIAPWQLPSNPGQGKPSDSALLVLAWVTRTTPAARGVGECSKDALLTSPSGFMNYIVHDGYWQRLLLITIYIYYIIDVINDGGVISKLLQYVYIYSMLFLYILVTSHLPTDAPGALESWCQHSARLPSRTRTSFLVKCETTRWQTW